MSTVGSALPLEVEDLTPEWFTAALDLPGTKVEAVEVESIIWGTATKVFVRLSYGAGAADGLPTDLCVKGGFNPDLRPMAGVGYLAEARFFGHLAPTLAVDLPRCWFVGEDPDHDQGIVVLDDLRSLGATFPTMVDPVAVDVVAAALEVQAGYHAATWDGAGLDGHGWLTLGSPVQRGIIGVMLGADHWDHHLGLPRGAGLPAGVLDRERMRRAFDRLWQLDDAAPTALSHGDAHVGNLYLQPAPTFLDWQGVCRAPWIDDVAYLIGGALEIEDRRAHERDLLHHYLAALRGHGVAAPEGDDAWLSYRQHQLHGFVWLLVPEVMQPEAVCSAMGERYAVACDDHKVFEALEV